VSDKNKISRASVKTSHTAGTKSYARWAEDLVSNLYLMHRILMGKALLITSKGHTILQFN
jgi:hypothetical protein